MRPTLDRDRDRAEIQRTAQLVPRDLQHRSRFELGTDPAHHLSDELLSRQGLRELCGGTEALERQRSLRGDRLQEGELVGREGSLRIGGGQDQHADHLVLGLHRHPGPALGADPRGQPGTDPRRAVDVVDRHGRRVEDGARDPRRLVLEIDPHVLPPVGRLAVQLRIDTARFIASVRDHDDAREADPEQGRDLAHERARRIGGGSRPHERIRDVRDRFELAVASRDSRLGLAGAADAAHDQRAVPPPREQQQGRRQRNERRGEREPRVTAERTAFVDDEHAEDPGCDRNSGKDEHDRPVEGVCLGALPPEDGQDRDGHGRVGGGQQQQRHAVEENCFGCLAHRASTI